MATANQCQLIGWAWKAVQGFKRGWGRVTTLLPTPTTFSLATSTQKQFREPWRYSAMAPDIHVNFRLRGIPQDCQSRSEVRELVGRVLPIESGTNLMIHSLAVNPTERTSRVATLTFNNIPHPLSDKTNDQWVFDLPRSDSSDDDDAYPRRRQLVFDTNFSGFTPLQHTEEEDCRVE